MLQIGKFLSRDVLFKLVIGSINNLRYLLSNITGNYFSVIRLLWYKTHWPYIADHFRETSMENEKNQLPLRLLYHDFPSHTTETGPTVVTKSG